MDKISLHLFFVHPFFCPSVSRVSYLSSSVPTYMTRAHTEFEYILASKDRYRVRLQFILDPVHTHA